MQRLSEGQSQIRSSRLIWCVDLFIFLRPATPSFSLLSPPARILRNRYFLPSVPNKQNPHHSVKLLDMVIIADIPSCRSAPSSPATKPAITRRNQPNYSASRTPSQPWMPTTRKRRRRSRCWEVRKAVFSKGTSTLLHMVLQFRTPRKEVQISRSSLSTIRLLVGVCKVWRKAGESLEILSKIRAKGLRQLF